MKSVCQFSCALAFVLGSSLLAFGQQPSQAPVPAKQKTQTAAPKKSVVWTDDNIASVRSSSDDYQIQQQDKKNETQQASAQKPSVGASEDSKSGRPIPEVKTVQQADDLIARDKQEIQSEQDYIQQTQKELASAPDSYKPRLGWRIQSRTNTITELQNEISAVQKQRVALSKQPPADVSSKPAAQPPSQ